MTYDSAASPEQRLDNLSVVLVETSFPGNLGAAARAMKNMGLTDLRLVNPPRDRQDEAQALASSARDVLDAARPFRSLEDAVADCAAVVGTTARMGGWRKKLWSPRDLTLELTPLTDRNRVALVFGPEDRGLSNEDIARCTHLVRIPTSRLMTSLNLSQAVLVLSYEFFHAISSLHWGERQNPVLATMEQRDAMFDHLQEGLSAIGYFPAGNEDYFMLDVKQMLNRACLERRDVAMLRGMARQMLWTARKSGQYHLLTWLKSVEEQLKQTES